MTTKQPHGMYDAPWVVTLREERGACLCADPDCTLSGNRAHVGPCEPCTCGLLHAIEECPENRTDICPTCKGNGYHPCLPCKGVGRVPSPAGITPSVSASQGETNAEQTNPNDRGVDGSRAGQPPRSGGVGQGAAPDFQTAAETNPLPVNRPSEAQCTYVGRCNSSRCPKHGRCAKCGASPGDHGTDDAGTLLCPPDFVQRTNEATVRCSACKGEGPPKRCSVCGRDTRPKAAHPRHHPGSLYAMALRWLDALDVRNSPARTDSLTKLLAEANSMGWADGLVAAKEADAPRTDKATPANHEAWLLRQLSNVASTLYSVWRCNTDEERRVHSAAVAVALERYHKHPSNIEMCLDYPMCDPECSYCREWREEQAK